MRTSLIDPVAPPSALAPLSETTTTIVLSRSPVSARNPSTRPICSSACERNPAKHSMNRAATARCGPARESQAGTQSGRGDSAVDGGTRPPESWRANVCSRQASQPRSNRPR